MGKEFEGKRLLILGGNPETVPLVEVANGMGIRTVVVSARHTDPAKAAAWKSYDVEGIDVPQYISIAREERVDGVLVGVADILVPAYCKVCDALGSPATPRRGSWTCSPIRTCSRPRARGTGSMASRSFTWART